MISTKARLRYAWALAAIVVFAAALRFCHACAVGGYYSPHVEQEEGYYEAGIALLSCHSLAQIPDSTPSAFRAPVYPSFLAFIEAFFSRPSPFHIRLAQAALSTLCIAAAGLLGWILFTPLAGLFAAALLAFNVEDILSVGSLNIHSFYGVAMLALGAAAVLWLERRDLRRAAFLGMMLATTLLCRPANFPFPLLFVAACLGLWSFPEGRWRALLPVAAFCAFFLAPMAVRNGLQFGSYSPFDLKGSYVLLRSTDGPHLRTTVEQAFDVAEELEPGFKARGLQGRPLHEALVGLAVRRIARSPLIYAGYCLERLYLFWRGLWPFLALAAFVLWRRRNDRPLQALVLTAASLSGYAVAGGAEEYRASATALLCVIGGAALASAVRAPGTTIPPVSTPGRTAGLAVLPTVFAVIYAAMCVFLGLELRDNFRPGPGPETRDRCADGRAQHVLETGMRQAGGRGVAGIFYDNMLHAALGEYVPVGAAELTHNYWMARAEAEAESGKRDDARVSLVRAERSNPGEYVSRRIVRLYRNLNDDRRARALIERLLLAHPRDAGLWVDRAELEARTGTRTAALGFLANAESSAPSSVARRRISDLYAELKDYRRAAVHLTPLLNREPWGAGLLIERASLEARTGAKDAALKTLAAAAASPDRAGGRRIASLYRELQEYGRASELVGALLAKDPGDAALWLERAEIQAQTGERAAALESLARAERSSPDDNTLRRVVGLYRELREARRASALLDALSRRRPQDPGLWLERAELQAQAGDRRAALASLARTESLNPTDVERRRAAGLYREQKDYSRASALLVDLLRRNPQDHGLWLERAELEAQMVDKRGALASLARAEKLLPPGADIVGEQSRRLALAYQSLGQYRRAIALWGALTRRFPAEGTFHGDKGLCEYLSGDEQAAVSSLRTAVRLKPKFLPAYLSLGAVHAAKGRLNEALKVYDEGLAAAVEGENDPLRKVLLDERAAAAARAR